MNENILRAAISIGKGLDSSSKETVNEDIIKYFHEVQKKMALNDISDSCVEEMQSDLINSIKHKIDLDEQAVKIYVSAFIYSLSYMSIEKSVVEYRKTREPGLAWSIISNCTVLGVSYPDEIRAYLEKTSFNLIDVAQSSNVNSFGKDLCRALGFEGWKGLKKYGTNLKVKFIRSYHKATIRFESKEDKRNRRKDGTDIYQLISKGLGGKNAASPDSIKKFIGKK